MGLRSFLSRPGAPRRTGRVGGRTVDAAGAAIRAAVRSTVEPLEQRLFLSTTVALLGPTLVARSLVVTADEGGDSGPSPDPEPPADTTPPDVAVSSPNIDTKGGTTTKVTVHFADASGIDVNRIDSGDISVVRDDGTNLGVKSDVAVDASDPTNVTAVYTVDVPGPAWDFTDNGRYVVTVKADSVRDLAGNGVDAAGTTFVVDVPGDTTAPTARIAAADVTDAGGASSTFKVTYTDDQVLSPDGLGAGGVTVTHEGGDALSVGVANTDLADDGKSAVVTYRVDAPGSAWDSADNGTYIVKVGAGSAHDASGNTSAATSASFTVNVPAPLPPPPPADTTGPSAAISAPDVLLIGAQKVVTVTYSDESGIGSIGSDSITVTKVGGGSVAVAGVQTQLADGGKTAVATYSLGSAGEAWDAADNGTYVVTVAAGKVKDGEGNGVAAKSADFKVAVVIPVPVPPVPVDSTGPTATVNTQGDVTAGGGATKVVAVTYTDPAGIDTSTIGLSDIEVIKGEKLLKVTDFSVAVADGGKTVVAAYTLAAPGGSWGDEDNGTWKVKVKAGAALDAGGHKGAEASGTFNVAIAAPVPPPITTPSPTPTPTPAPADQTGPTTQITGAPSVTQPGGTNYAFTVQYADDGGVDASRIDKKDVSVIGPDGESLKVIGAAVSASVDGKVVTATYTVRARGAAWGPADNGTYTINVKGKQVVDASGNAAGDAAATFDVGIVLPKPPKASISPSDDITEVSSDAKTITVTYADDTAVDASTIGLDDLLISRDGGTSLVVTGVNVQPPGNAKRLTATYTVAAPAGGWSADNSGVYIVTLRDGAVFDTEGHAALAVSGLFRVDIAVPKPAIDTGFGFGAQVVAPFVGEAAATQADGKIVVVGRQGSLTAGNSSFVIKRLNADGTADGSFGDNGMVVGSGGNDAAFAVAVQDDGKIVIAGTRNSDFLVARFSANGSADGKFGNGGIAVADLGAADDSAFGVALAADGSIVLAGGAGGQFAFARFLTSGQLDGTFGQAGVAHANPGGGTSAAGVVVLQADGKIVSVGASGANVAVVRLNTDGSADGSFGAGGTALISELGVRDNLGRPDYTEGLALQGDNILVANSVGGNFGLVRLDSAGNLDASFGNGGVVTADFGGDDDADAIVVQASGEIIVLGTTDQGGNGRTAVAAFEADGTPSAGFGNAGETTVDSGVGGNGRALHIGDLVLRAFGGQQGNGQVVVGTSDQTAQSATPTGANTGLRRLNVPGSGLLGKFGADGRKSRKLSFMDSDGTKVTISLKGGGTGKAYYDGSKVDLVLTGAGAKSSLTIKGKGGDGFINLRNVRSDGGLKSVSAKTANLTGTLSVGGGLAKAAFRSISGTVAASGNVGSLSVARDLTGARLLSGANYGTDGKPGGTGMAADSYQQGQIASLKVGGDVDSSVVAAGLTTRNTTLLDSDDAVVGGDDSCIRSIVVKGAVDDSTRFVAGSFGKAKVPGSVDTSQDEHFDKM